MPVSLLALETSTERLSLAVRAGGRTHARDVDAGQRHSELAIPLLRELLAEAGAELRQLDAIAFGQGPGSFTGVRIACGLAQGLALGAAKPAVPVETQMALAEQSGASRVLVALDARMNEIYFAAYIRDEMAACGWHREIAPCLVAPADLPAVPGGDWTGIGSAFDAAALVSTLVATYGAQLTDTFTGALPRASDVAIIAERLLIRGEPGAVLPPERAAPLYLRNKVALTIAERAGQKQAAA